MRLRSSSLQTRMLAAFLSCVGFFAGGSARAGEGLGIAAAGGVVPSACATVAASSEKYYCFKGPAARASLYIPHLTNPNQYFGIFGGAASLVNTFEDENYKESMSLREGGVTWQFASLSRYFDVEAGLGLSQVTVEQTMPIPRQDVYKTGVLGLAALDFGLIGSREGSLFLRGEVSFRSYTTGSDQLNPDAKLLPFKLISNAVYLGLGSKF